MDGTEKREKEGTFVFLSGSTIRRIPQIKNSEDTMTSMDELTIEDLMDMIKIFAEKIDAKKAFDLYSLFWAVNMGMIDTSGIKKLDDNMLNKKDEKKTGLMGKFSAIVKKVIDCCIE